MPQDAASQHEEQDDALIGRTIAEKFRIETFLGRGAMGAVYRATQLNLKKRVAIKVMNADKRDGTYASRFKREAKAAARMEHPNLLRVIDFGEEPDGLLYIAMELLDGKDLLNVLREDFPFTTARIVSVLSQTLAALAIAHEMGVIHRDLKPENIMLLPSKDDEGRPSELVKVCDFGVAKIVAGSDRGGMDFEDGAPDPTRTGTHTGTLTAYGTLIGTPEYMSPEQGRGEPADARSDLYSLGVILFLMLTGRLPFDEKSKIRLVLKQIEELPPMPSDIDSQVDLKLEAICMKALEKRAEDRYQSAREMRVDVRAVLDDSRPIQKPSLAQQKSREKRPSSAPPALHEAPTAATTSGPPPSEAVPSVVNVAKTHERSFQVQHTATIQDPNENAQAIQEARKRLHASNPPSVPPPPGAALPQATVTTVRPPGENNRAMLIAIVIVAVVVGLYLMSR